MKQGGRGFSGGRFERRSRGLLVVAQVALAVVLVNGAGLLMKSFARLSAVNPGFRTEHVLTAGVSLPGARYRQPQDVSQAYDRILTALSETHWNKSRAAEKLHWSRMTLYRKMTRYRISKTFQDAPIPAKSNE